MAIDRLPLRVPSACGWKRGACTKKPDVCACVTTLGYLRFVHVLGRCFAEPSGQRCVALGLVARKRRGRRGHSLLDVDFALTLRADVSPPTAAAHQPRSIRSAGDSFCGYRRRTDCSQTWDSHAVRDRWEGWASDVEIARAQYLSPSKEHQRGSKS